jgi:RNA polymerase sigma-70 factor (ECF subfamily)
LNSLADAQREKGKFRSFLLAAMNHFLADEWDRAKAQKRGAERTIPLDTTWAETRYQGGPASELPPDRLFERQWSMTLLETVLGQLHQEYAASGRGELFLALRFAITGDKSDLPYAELAAHLNLTEPAVRVAVHRLKQRYRKMLRMEIADTVADESEIAAELNYLRRVLSA